MSNPDPVLEVRDVVKTYGGVRALAGVSLSLGAGEVHCLAGENGSGKSTLIKIISGVEVPDSGTISIDGTERPFMTPNEAIRNGIQVIYQDFSLFPNLTVAENIAMLSELAADRRLYSGERAHALAAGIVDELGIRIDLGARVEELPVADRQLIAVCRALVGEARVLIMDEPTTALTHTEVDRLFTIVRRLQSRGVAVVFVSHKLDEVLQISQQLTILRNGELIESGPADRYDTGSIARAMTGRDVASERRVDELGDDAPIRLAVEGLGRSGGFADVTFDLRAGEILGITGLLGSGRAAIAEAIFGVAPADTGTVRVDGRSVTIDSIGDAIDAGIGYVPEDRLTQGLFLDKSIADNMVAASLGSYASRAGVLDRNAIRAAIDRLFSRLRIQAPNVDAPVRSLSGGNAQRVVLAKWLDRNPSILILNGPTVGVDIGSKEEILTILREQAAEGMAIMLISDDITELVSACHRVLVIRNGRIEVELDGDRIDADTIEERMAS